MKSAIVVGAGLAGLASGLELARAGLRVDVFEACDRAGGRAQLLCSPDGRFRFDMGPTLIVMRDCLQRALGEPAFTNLQLRRLEPGYRILWPDESHFDMHSDIALWLREIERFRPGGAAAALRYLAMVHEPLLSARERILENPWTLRTAGRLFRPGGKVAPWMFGGLRRFAERHLVHPRLVQAATLQPLYLGLTPRRSPAIYGFLMSDEVLDGVWYAPGGTAAIVAAFVAECTKYGVRFHYDAPVSRVIVERGRGRGVLVGNERRHADAVVVAADREPAARKLFERKAGRRRIRYGHSALVLYLGFEGALDMPHHVVFLPEDPWHAYEQLDRGQPSDDVLLYIHHPARSDPGATPGAITALALVPNRRALPELDVAAVSAQMLARLERHYGPLRERLVYQKFRGPREFEEELGVGAGAAFGPDHTLSQMGPFRPAIAYRGARNVAFAGAGTHPGSGVPMVMISGRLAAQRLLAAIT